MNLVIGKSGSSITLDDVISYTVTNKDNPTIQVVHKSGDSVHVDIIQSQDALNAGTTDFGS